MKRKDPWDRNVLRIIAKMVWETRCNQGWRNEEESLLHHQLEQLDATESNIKKEMLKLDVALDNCNVERERLRSEFVVKQ